jgi:tetraacyldisaccharide 4'-kinase
VHANWYGPPTWRTWLLAPAALTYALLVRIWHLAFDLGLRRAIKVPGATVISVGNLVVGGSGKTPVVIHLTNAALATGHRVAVLSRGYGRTSTQLASFTAASLPPVEDVGDEPRLIARRCPGATVWVGSDRVELARRAVAAGANLLILDDGFQHRRLARDVDLLVDAGLGNGWMLPAGPLREPASGRKRATHVWGRDGRPGDVEARHQLTSVRAPDGSVLPLTVLQGQPVVLLLGVARPDLVRASVEALGATVERVHAFPDHHVFSAAELAAARASNAWLLTTEKDAERLPAGVAHVLILDVEVLRGTLPLAVDAVGRGRKPAL